MAVPAGIVKPGATAATTAVRETASETGVRCVVVAELGSRLHPETDVYCSYLLCDYVTGEPRNLDPDENADVTWIPAGRLTAVVPESSVYPPVPAALDHDRQRFALNGRSRDRAGSTVRTTGDGEEQHG